MAFVVSEGQLASVHRAPLPALPAAIRLDEFTAAEHGQIYRAQPNVRTVVSFLARNIAQLGLPVYRRVSDTDRERLNDHPLAGLIRRPNPSMTRYRLVERLVSDLAIYDDALWVKVRLNGQIGGLVPIPPSKFRPLGDNWLSADAYEIVGSRGRLEVAAANVVHFRGYNPETSREGCSAMETLRSLLVEEWEGIRWRQQMWRNGARASGFIERPAEAPDWSDKARKRFKSDFEALYAGDGPGAGGTPILEDGMKYTTAGLDFKSAQYVEARKLTREEVAAAYHIPPPLVGILDHATYSNIQEQHKILYADTLGPWLTMIAEEIALQLLPDLPDSDGVYCEFNIAEKLRGSFEEQAGQLQTSVGAPWVTRNEARARMNLPGIDGGDELVTPLNVLIGGQASPTDSAPEQATTASRPAITAKAYPPIQVKARAGDDHVEDLTGLLKRFFARQERAVLSRAGVKTRGLKATADDVFDTQRWVEELAADLYGANARMARAVVVELAAQLGIEDQIEPTVEAMLAWLQANADGVAEGINDVTRTAVADALGEDEPGDALRNVFAVAVSQRAPEIAETQVTGISGFAGEESAQAAGYNRKTWVVTSARPRGSHARLNGETVPVGETFSNGARWPGDPVLEAKERAHCRCDLRLSLEETT